MSSKAQQSVEDKRKRLAELRARREARAKGGTTASSSSAAASPSSSAGVGSSSSAASILAETSSLIGEQRNVTLTGVQDLAVHNILPREKHVYEMGCQTEGPKLSGKAKDMEEELNKQLVETRLKEQKLNELQEQLKHDKIKYDNLREEERLAEPAQMSNDEQNKILESSSFKQFFGKASTMMERALNSSYDFTIDYTGGDDEKSSEKDSKLVLMTTFKDKATGGRPVTALSWSPKYPELLLASYASQDDPLSFDPDGTLRVWNMHMPSRPEYSFFCNSAVLSAQFHPTNSHLIIGACQSGQVVLWDTRDKEYPVNRTSLSNGHTSGIYGLTSIPIVNKLHNIVSMSTDGHLCVWSDNDLHAPSTEVRLSHGKEEITTTSLDYAHGDTNNLVLASDEGYLYKAQVYDKAGIHEAIKAHEAPISSVNFHPTSRNENLNDLYLTSSYDWTVKLWSMKSTMPLYTFESARDYVFDAQWSPTHPALFAMGDGSGRIDLWNVAKDTEAPVFSTYLEETSFNHTGDKAAVSRMAWNDKGTALAVGTSTGSIQLYAVRPEIAEAGDDEAATLYEKTQAKLLSQSHTA